ncbi:MAG TPA: hypothetical protein VF487_04875 [Chitinophagaceae bacterium]
MTKETNTEKITLELDKYLGDNNFFDDLVTENEINRLINKNWKAKFIIAITSDIHKRYEDLQVDISYSKFELYEENTQGGPCTFFHQAILTDPKNSEALKIFVKTLINYNMTTVYLDSIYANDNHYPGKSKRLSEIFKKLKAADSIPGYFNPIRLNELAYK